MDLKKFRRDKPLYRPVKSDRPGKKMMVYVRNEQGGRMLKHFGDANMQDYTQHKDEKRRKSYLARAKGIRDKNGNLTWKDKNSANYWAVRVLWNG